jgi:phage internal scaffolding protein
MSKKNNVYEFYTPYTNRKKPCFFETTGESMTQQHFADESEINNIIRSHDRNGVIEHIHRGNAIYGDFSEITDLSDALVQIQEAQKEFLNIPSEIREKFKNDAGEFFKYASNPDNEEGMREMGLLNPTKSSAMPEDKANLEAVEPHTAQTVPD